MVNGSILCLLLVITCFSMRHVLAKTRWISHSVIGRHGSIADVSNSTLGVCLAYVIVSFKLTSRRQFQKIFVISLKSRTDRRDSMALAAALTGIDVEFVDGITSVENKTLPPGGKERQLNREGIYNWRAHSNVLRM